MKPSEYFTIISLWGVAVGNTFHFTLAMIFSNGMLDINALKNQYGWSVGEGWFEVAFYLIISLFGLRLLLKNKQTVLTN